MAAVGAGPLAAPTVRVDVFLLAGQFPGTSHALALRNAMAYAMAAERAGFDGVLSSPTAQVRLARSPDEDRVGTVG